ncbi:hypothetical protein DFP97_13512 [Paenibacillus prosopidis]|uniref:HTH merR-type domain-containing protein n=1 Tax=Paenibacillus prosopidis TaxID=630520 RepID=A0A368VGE4_9BACL|nr:hypothetical protein DFP97_13512 [Paenibacillus prosopidis]
MFKIGDFARLSKVTVKALRHYESVDCYSLHISTLLLVIAITWQARCPN